MVAQFFGVEVVAAAFAAVFSRFAYACAQRGNQGDDVGAGEQALVAGFFYVQDFAAQGQNGLELAVAPLLGAATSRVALHNVDFAQCGVFFLAVCQFAGQAKAIKHTFAARHFAGFAGGFAGAGGINDFAAEDFCVGWFFFQIIGERFGNDVFHWGAHFAAHQLVFGLAAEFGLWHFD